MAMRRRAFIHSALVHGGVDGVGDRVRRPARSPQRQWIIPTNKPDRFGLKVMAFNPILKPDPALYACDRRASSSEPLSPDGGRPRSPGEVKPEQPPQVRAVLVRPDRLGRLPRPGAAELARAEGGGRWVAHRLRRQVLRLREAGDLLHPRTLFATAMHGEALTPEHGAPLRLVLPHKYGYKSSKLITSLTFVDKGGKGLQADGMPYYSETGDILPGVDHPFEFPDDVRKIPGGEITEY
jgi:hypothetical protein